MKDFLVEDKHMSKVVNNQNKRTNKKKGPNKRLRHKNNRRLDEDLKERFSYLAKDKRYKASSDGIPQHRKVFEEHWGFIENGWHVHHLDTNPTNNDPMNLIQLPGKCHQWLHWNQIALRRKYDRNGALGYVEAWLNRRNKMLLALQREDPVKIAIAVQKYKALKIRPDRAKQIRKGKKEKILEHCLNKNSSFVTPNMCYEQKSVVAYKK